MPLSVFHPVVSTWFRQRLGEPTLPQVRGWPSIVAGRDVLISAPTGSGKTLSAFLASLDALVSAGLTGQLREETRVLYVSPLKALSSDVRRNLQGPLGEITMEAERQGLLLPAIKVGLRTGDTPAAERQAMVRRPPHILVTTPESLFLCLTAEKTRRMLATVETVIIDEVHALLPSKRGSQLTLCLEWLDAVCVATRGRRPQRIGLSATVHPIDEVARFLVGTQRVPMQPGTDAPGEADCVIVDGRPSSARELDLRVATPKQPLGPICTGEQWQDIHDQVADLIRKHRTTLVFVSTRGMCERVAHQLAERLGNEAVMAHHGSLSRTMRLRVEERLKSGELQAVVATASLELGIDIGAVELVCQIGSPRAISTFLQRLGRANHRPGPDAVPRARLFALTRDDLVECAALVRAARRGLLDRQILPPCPVDVLAQQLVAMCAAAGEDGLAQDTLFQLVRGAWPFHALTQERYTEVLTLLAEGVATRRGRPTAHLHWDRVNGRVRGRRGARLFVTQNGGTIPEPNDFEVVVEGQEIVVGRLEEEFVVESSPGDVFLLGTTPWRLLGVRGGRAYAADAGGATPTVPFWRGEAPGRTLELSAAVATLRADLETHIVGDRTPISGTPAVQTLLPGLIAVAALPEPNLPVGRVVDRALLQQLIDECGVPADGALQLVEYLRAGRAALGHLPTQKLLIAERFFDEGGGMQLVLHMPFGARQNRAFGLALRKKFCRAFNFELEAAATDDGVLISLGETHSFPLETVWQYLNSQSIRNVLSQAVLGAPIFQPHFRHVATRALSIPRRRNGKKVPPPIIRVMTEDLLGAVFPNAAACPENLPGGDIEIPGHPLVDETMRECVEEVMDIDGLERLLRQIERGEVQMHAVDTSEPSPLAEQLVHAAPYAFLDDTPFEDRRTRAVRTEPGRKSQESVLTHVPEAGLDAQAVEAVRAQAWPKLRDVEELHDALLTLHVLPVDRLPAGGLVQSLIAMGRASWLHLGDARLLVAAERAQAVRLLYNAAHAEQRTAQPPPTLHPEPPSVAETRFRLEEVGVDELICVEIVRGWLALTGPWRQRVLAETLMLPADRVGAALLRLEAEGMALRGWLLPGDRPTADEPQFCDRRLLAQIHRHTRQRFQREHVPATTAELWQFFARWQHAWPGTQLLGGPGLLRILEQLQGYVGPASAWEEAILPSRLRSYSTLWLDDLCLSGEVSWGALRQRASTATSEGRVAFSRVTPLGLWRRVDAEWLLALQGAPKTGGSSSASEGESAGLDAHARALLEALDKKGARFLSELARDVGASPQEVLTGLGTLAAAGLVTADGAAGLRLLISHLTLRSAKSTAGASLGAGRWSRLEHTTGAAANASGESTSRAWHQLESVLSTEADWDNPAILESWAKQYLARWGILVREILLREPAGPPLSAVARILRRMEARGQVRSGYFVTGLSGEQFASPEALEGLRLVQKLRRGPSSPVDLTLSAADPLNLTGVLFAGARIAATSTAGVLFRNGEPAGTRPLHSDENTQATETG